MEGVVSAPHPWGWLLLQQASVPPDDEWLVGEEVAKSAQLQVIKRRMSWRLGRFTAKSALCQWAPASCLRDWEIRSAADGAPEVWRDGAAMPVAISLSHRRGRGLCVLASAEVGIEEVPSVGCDLEFLEPRSEAFVRDYFTRSERAYIHALGRQPPLMVSRAVEDAMAIAETNGTSGLGQAQKSEVSSTSPEVRKPLETLGSWSAVLFWSAKESALKVLRTGLHRDTRSVVVEEVAVEPSASWQPLRVRDDGPRGGQFYGYWRLCGLHVVTVLSDRVLPPPRRLSRQSYAKK